MGGKTQKKHQKSPKTLKISRILPFFLDFRMGARQHFLNALYIHELLLLVNDQITSILTWRRIVQVFQKNSAFDLRNLLSGTDHLTSSLIKTHSSKSPSILTNTVNVGSFQDHAISTSLIKSTIEKTLSKNQNIIFTIIFNETGQILSYGKRKEGYSLHYRDAALISNMVVTSGIFQQSCENWTPICLPNSIDSAGFAQLYMCKPEELDFCLVLISNFYKEEEFHMVSEISKELQKKWEGKISVPKTGLDFRGKENLLFSEGGVLDILSAIVIKGDQSIMFNYNEFSHENFVKIINLTDSQNLSFIVLNSQKSTTTLWKRDELTICAVFGSLTTNDELIESLQAFYNKLMSNENKYFTPVINF